MRKILVCLAALLVVALPALAQTQDVDGAFSLTLPDDLKAVELAEDDKADGLLMEMEGDGLRVVAYIYEPDPSYDRTVDDMYQEYLADQEEGFYTGVALEEIGGARMLVYDTGAGTLGAITIARNGSTYEFIAICEDDSRLSQAKAIIESIKAA